MTLTKIRENNNGTVFTADKISHNLFNFYVLKKKTFNDGTCNWHLCAEYAKNPDKYMILETMRGTHDEAVAALKLLLTNKS